MIASFGREILLDKPRSRLLTRRKNVEMEEQRVLGSYAQVGIA
jgi:hypothetical protein